MHILSDYFSCYNLNNKPIRKIKYVLLKNSQIFMQSTPVCPYSITSYDGWTCAKFCSPSSFISLKNSNSRAGYKNSDFNQYISHPIQKSFKIVSCKIL